MVQLHELLSPEEIQSLVPKLSERMLELAASRESEVQHESRFVIPTRDHPSLITEVLEPLARWVNTMMMREAIPHKAGELPAPYTHVWTGQIGNVMARFPLEGIWDNVQRNRVSRQLTLYMKRIRVAENTGYRHQTWYCRAMPRSIESGKTTPSKTVIVEAQRQQAKHPPEPVRMRFDLRKIPFPDEVTPASLVEYVQKLVKASNVLVERLADLQDELMTVTKERDELLEALKELEQDEWEQAALRVHNIVHRLEE